MKLINWSKLEEKIWRKNIAIFFNVLNFLVREKLFRTRSSFKLLSVKSGTPMRFRNSATMALSSAIAFGTTSVTARRWMTSRSSNFFSSSKENMVMCHSTPSRSHWMMKWSMRDRKEEESASRSKSNWRNVFFSAKISSVMTEKKRTYTRQNPSPPRKLSNQKIFFVAWPLQKVKEKNEKKMKKNEKIVSWRGVEPGTFHYHHLEFVAVHFQGRVRIWPLPS